GIAGQRSPAAPALFQTSRPYLPSSFQVSRCGTYSAAMKRRACSSSSTRSSVIQPGRGRLRTFMSNPVDRTAYRAPPHYARATSVAKGPPLLFTTARPGEEGRVSIATRQFAIDLGPVAISALGLGTSLTAIAALGWRRLPLPRGGVTWRQ